MEKIEKIWSKNFILLFITNLLVLAAFYASIPIIPIYCQQIGIVYFIGENPRKLPAACMPPLSPASFSASQKT